MSDCLNGSEHDLTAGQSDTLEASDDDLAATHVCLSGWCVLPKRILLDYSEMHVALKLEVLSSFGLPSKYVSRIDNKTNRHSLKRIRLL